ncbi:hypothetical protein L1987_76683 [Smallanthus sonchifolius]|uniref:Uncharacterized protein n=1 Tax=Smallanthus sonchifolius TaxID=185202 RepID=A0ACB8Z8P6_9ASTR|nr:hypothetical protein L1987_76683 [Smallanthus sonchifolius]
MGQSMLTPNKRSRLAAAFPWTTGTDSNTTGGGSGGGGDDDGSIDPIPTTFLSNPPSWGQLAVTKVRPRASNHHERSGGDMEAEEESLVVDVDADVDDDEKMEKMKTEKGITDLLGLCFVFHLHLLLRTNSLLLRRRAAAVVVFCHYCYHHHHHHHQQNS